MNNPMPSTAGLLKASAAAIMAATVILLTAVLPAEYGIDPTGVGSRLGLLTLANTAQAAPAVAAPVVQSAESAALPSADTAVMAAQAVAVFGKQAGQSFDAHAVARGLGTARTDTMSVTLAPGKGAEVKAMVDAGQSFVFHWSASADVAVDMHGEVPGASEYTSYWLEGKQREGGGTFTAKFAGQHGWYWRNKGTEPVTVQVSVTGFQTKLFRPGH